MNWNRWSAFFCLCGLTAFVPAVFVPAMLVANAVDGPRWYSVWSGIREFFRSGQTFLASLIFCFSLLFPLLKFGLGLLCSAGGGFLPHRWRRGIVAVTSWSAKYSMLDVMVIAMLIMLVKVNEYVRVLPSLGLYLFSISIFLSALAGAALSRAIARERSQEEQRKLAAKLTAASDSSSLTPAKPDSLASPDAPGVTPAIESTPRTAPPSRRHLRWPAWALGLVAGLGLSGYGALLLKRDSGGAVQSVELSRLTNRGDLRRSVEKAIALKELAKEEHKFFSRDTWRRFLELGQALTTDAGWKSPEAWVTLETRQGKTLQSASLPAVDLDDPALRLRFVLPESVSRADIHSLQLVSNLQIAKVIKAPIEEERIGADSDPFRKWTNTWHGRIFSFDLQGPNDPGLRQAILLTATGAILAMWSLAALLTPARKSLPPTSC